MEQQLRDVFHHATRDITVDRVPPELMRRIRMKRATHAVVAGAVAVVVIALGAFTVSGLTSNRDESPGGIAASPSPSPSVAPSPSPVVSDVGAVPQELRGSWRAEDPFLGTVMTLDVRADEVVFVERKGAGRSVFSAGAAGDTLYLWFEDCDQAPTDLTDRLAMTWSVDGQALNFQLTNSPPCYGNFFSSAFQNDFRRTG